MADIAPILHVISPLAHVSPFDINMALDAGYTTIVPYPNVKLDEMMDAYDTFARAGETGALKVVLTR